MPWFSVSFFFFSVLRAPPTVLQFMHDMATYIRHPFALMSSSLAGLEAFSLFTQHYWNAGLYVVPSLLLGTLLRQCAFNKRLEMVFVCYAWCIARSFEYMADYFTDLTGLISCADSVPPWLPTHATTWFGTKYMWAVNVLYAHAWLPKEEKSAHMVIASFLPRKAPLQILTWCSSPADGQYEPCQVERSLRFAHERLANFEMHEKLRTTPSSSSKPFWTTNSSAGMCFGADALVQMANGTHKKICEVVTCCLIHTHTHTYTRARKHTHTCTRAYACMRP